MLRFLTSERLQLPIYSTRPFFDKSAPKQKSGNGLEWWFLSSNDNTSFRAILFIAFSSAEKEVVDSEYSGPADSVDNFLKKAHKDFASVKRAGETNTMMMITDPHLETAFHAATQLVQKEEIDPSEFKVMGQTIVLTAVCKKQLVSLAASDVFRRIMVCGDSTDKKWLRPDEPLPPNWRGRLGTSEND